MRLALAAMLSLMFLGAPAAAADRPAVGDDPGRRIPELLLLVPVSRLTDLRASVSDSLAQEITLPAPAEALWIAGEEYTLIALPGERLDEFEGQIAGTRLHEEVKLVLAIDETGMEITDLPRSREIEGAPRLRAAVARGQLDVA